MASNLIWYAGRCVRRTEHEKIAYLQVIAQLVDGEWKMLDNVQRLFGGADEVEMRGADLRTVKVADWGKFTIAGQKKRAKFWQVGTYRRMRPYVDLSDVGNIEQIQLRLAAVGIETQHSSGTWIVRSSKSEILNVELKQINGIAQLSTGNGSVHVFPFESKSLVRMKISDDQFELYDLRPDGPPTEVHDWSADEEFALRIARAIGDASDSRMREIITWLEEHSKKGQGLLSIEGKDFAAANDALRSGKLAKRLSTDRLLMQSFVDALFLDERVMELFKECGNQLAEHERTRLRARAEADIQVEIEQTRQRRLVLLEKELTTDVENRRAQNNALQEQSERKFNSEMQELRERAEAELDKSIVMKKTALEKLAADLEARCNTLEEEVSRLTAEADNAAKQAVLCRAEEDDLRTRLDILRVQADQVKIEFAETKRRLTAAQQKGPFLLLPCYSGKVLVLSQVGAALAASPLLSENGKNLMAKFLALTLAGEVPVLCGPDVKDFLFVAELMFTNGTSARLEADPTIITFEDLWSRAGTEVRTALSQAHMIASGAEGSPRTTLAVIEKAERSGARFWYPMLADRARRGELPRRLLTCVTIGDEECEEAREILTCAVRLDVRDVLGPTSALAAVKDVANGIVGELDPGVRVLEIAKGIGIVAPHLSRLGMNNTLRVVRVVSEATQLGSSIDLPSLVQLFLGDDLDTNISSSQRSNIHA